MSLIREKMSSLVKNILQLLKNEIPFSEYDKYVKQLSHNEKESKSNIIAFNVPNILVLNWTKTKYAEKLCNLFEQETGIKHSIKFILKNKTISDKTGFSNDDMEKQRGSINSILNPSYNFDSFIIGKSNNYAYTVAKAAASKPGIVYNPIFIYGPTGIGKTH